MSKVTEYEKELLRKERGDSEGYHAVFDDLLEQKLKEVDPEWIEEMLKIYRESGEFRWFA